jgi:hypothetical protein
MNEPAAFRTVMRGVAFGNDTETVRGIHDALDEDGHGRLLEYSLAVMTICVEHRFSDDLSYDSIREFVNEMRDDFRDADPPLKALAVEVVLRGMAGEEHLFDEIPVIDQVNVRYALVRKIVAESPELQADFENVLDQADRMLERWADDEEDDDFAGPATPWTAG